MIYIGLGANLPSRYGTPFDTLLAAVAALEVAGLSVLKCSSIWLSAPVPMSDQPWYHNAVINVGGASAPLELLSCLKQVEAEFGRVDDVRNAPRVLDLDILAYGDDVFAHERCSIPHIRMHERAFVLYPLRELAPSWVHPESGKSIDALIDCLPAGQEIQRLEKEFVSHGAG